MCNYHQVEYDCSCKDEWWEWCSQPAAGEVRDINWNCGNGDAQRTQLTPTKDRYYICCNVECCEASIKNQKLDLSNPEVLHELPRGTLLANPSYPQLPPHMHPATKGKCKVNCNAYLTEVRGHSIECVYGFWDGKTFTNLARVRNGLAFLNEYKGEKPKDAKGRRELREKLEMHLSCLSPPFFEHHPWPQVPTELA